MCKVIIFLGIMFSLFSCEDGKSLKERELDIREREIKQKENELKIQEQAMLNSTIEDTKDTVEEPITVTKYLYVVIVTDEPVVKTMITQKTNTFSENVLNLPELIEETPYTESRYRQYRSDVITVSNYTKDNDYVEKDKFEKKIKDQTGNNYDSRIGQIQTTIISNDVFVFDSYSEASISRAKK